MRCMQTNYAVLSTEMTSSTRVNRRSLASLSPLLQGQYYLYQKRQVPDCHSVCDIQSYLIVLLQLLCCEEGSVLNTFMELNTH